jgi:predicted acetyltransferase
MSFVTRWAGADELDRVADARLCCYTTAENQREVYRQWARDDNRPGAYILAESDGQAVGTATAFDMNMWVRGARLPCQGVAWVGTIKTHRRSGRESQRGIASGIMSELLKRARQQGQVVSALMPFRVSFYQHFGYGLVERRDEWTIPLPILPHGESRSVRFMTPADLPAVQACRKRADEKGQCAIERTGQSWAFHEVLKWASGYRVVDQPERGGDVHGWLDIVELNQDGRKSLRIDDAVWDSNEALLRLLHFLAGLRDQFGSVTMAFPADLPVNRLLREPQLPHRPVEHLTASVAPQTRMQVRILDHKAFLESLELPVKASGSVSIAIHESEGSVSSLSIELDEGRIKVGSAPQSPDVDCPDHIWASVATGHLRASTAASVGLLKVRSAAGLEVLDALAAGPTPFCREYF